MTDIAVIIINYNTSNYTLECIDTVVKRTSEPISYDIIVVDNNSEPDDYIHLKTHFPKKDNIKLYRSDINTGFGGGNMFGVQFAKAKYFLFLNNDAMLLNDCLSILKDFMDQHPQVGVCTAQNYDEHHNFVPSFDHNKGLRRFLFGRGFLEKINPKRYPKRKNEYQKPLKVDWVNGAFLFFRSEAFLKVGGFDTRVFLYWEEMDICYRLKKQGYDSFLVPEAKVLHFQGKSIGKSVAINKEGYISYLHVLRKNYSFLKYAVIRLYLVVALLLKPKKWYLLSVLLKADPSSESLRHKQKPRTVHEHRN
ncbi:glycosyltransferase family 2 protein [Constantimarinum furrinae]|uniref:Glycosyltransferase n=1 Tax=Constantimarinum furrinae TaxID=2562285 RepID=A0A7G8PVI6_9FLAO|nr:glycosyltransferase family 2 protein [Constantimarinum furrinae]QNJ98352.1 glycosyltransferase [Constantimarinum furrinae]